MNMSDLPEDNKKSINVAYSNFREVLIEHANIKASHPAWDYDELNCVVDIIKRFIEQDNRRNNY